MTGNAQTRQLLIDPRLDIRSTVTGAKMALLIGATESWWSTRTPQGPGSLHMKREDETQVQAQAPAAVSSADVMAA